MRRGLGRSRVTGVECAYLLPGQRVYAIGDIHGRYDLLEDLLGRIDADRRERGPAATSLVFLGDYINRGAQSSSVIDRLMGLTDAVFLMGNHEELLLRALSGERRAMGIFARIGGVRTMASYGVDAARFMSATIEEKAVLMSGAIPSDHVEWLRQLPPCYMNGDYMFVHAGILPGQPVENQTPEVMRWIRDDFLDSTADHGKVIVHGHSVMREIDERPNRIGIDTGAFFSEILTAIALEHDQRWYVQTSPATAS